MGLVERWLRHPQGVWLRKALFQVHLWTGLILALYVLVMSLTGTVLIYRRELAKAFSGEPKIVAAAGHRLTADELRRFVETSFPGYVVTRSFESKNPNR